MNENTPLMPQAPVMPSPPQFGAGASVQYGAPPTFTAPQQIVMQPAQVVIQAQQLSCSDICCRCQAPNLGTCCNCICGISNMILPGSGLFFGGCCARVPASCCAVVCAGTAQFFTFPVIFGWVSSCCVGFKMFGGCSKKKNFEVVEG